MFRALILDKAGDSVIPRIADVDDDALPEGDVTVAIEYSSFNDKDGLVVSGVLVRWRWEGSINGSEWSL